MCIIMDDREGNFNEKNFKKKPFLFAVVTAEKRKLPIPDAGTSNELSFDGEIARG